MDPSFPKVCTETNKLLFCKLTPYVKLLDVVAGRDTRMVVVAGDVSYANGLRSCYRRWDDWLTTWQQHMRTIDGHLMPLLTSIGNHDVGME